MSDTPRTVRKRTNVSAAPSARWTDEDRSLLWQLRQEQSHLTWTELYNVIGPQFPGRSKSAITQECQKMEREDAKRRIQLIKDRRNDHVAVSPQGKRPIGDQTDTVKGRLPKEPRLDDNAGEQSSDDGGDIEYESRRQPSVPRQSPNAPRPCENPPTLPKIQSMPQPCSSPNAVGMPDLPSHMHASQARPDGGVASLPAQAPINTVPSSISSGNHQANHAVGTAKYPGPAPQGNIIPDPPTNEGPHQTSPHYSKPGHKSLQLPPQPPTPLPPPSQPCTSHLPAQPGEPNKQYIETLTGDQCLDGAVHLLARLTQIRIKEGIAQGERLNESAALKLRIEELESQLDAQSKQLSAVELVGNVKLLAMEKQMEETRKEMEKIREESKGAAQRLNELCGVVGIFGVAAKLINAQGEQSVLEAGDGK